MDRAKKRTNPIPALSWHRSLYNNQINVRALIGQSAVGHGAGKPTEKSHVF